MTEQQKRFLELAMIQQLTYDEISKKLNTDRKLFSQWWEELKKERKTIAKIRRIRGRKCPKVAIEDFYYWFTNTAKECHYCKITESKIAKLFAQDRIHTKRRKTRGRSLEIERMDPERPYSDLENLVFSCYWCNNAKTDEFSAEEFKIMGESIAKIWKRRLAKI